MITGTFWELTSGNCFRILCLAWFDSGYMFICQFIEGLLGRIPQVFLRES